MKAALLQLCASDDPAANLPDTLDMVRSAAAQGAKLVLTPEVTNCVSSSRERQLAVLQSEEADQTLQALREAAAAEGIWIAIGSLALKTDDTDGRFANRSFLIAPDGAIVARYDKIHMFDVDVSPTETYRESAGYRPGNRAVVADLDKIKVGLSVCYDVRFAHLYRALAKAGAEVLLVPAAFSQVTGAAHWEPLLRARAIETGCYVLAAAQSGEHKQVSAQVRRTYGHSIAISPWGEVLADAGTDIGITFLDLDPQEVTKARKRVPALFHDRPFEGPND